MHILVTNDDGIDSPGLHALQAAARKLGRVSVLAPDRNWSVSGHARKLNQPLQVWEYMLPDGSPALACDGTPSDCVSLALMGMVPEPVDLVLSGINPHANIGHDVTYSGTVTAAMEAAIYGVPGFAVSLDAPDHHFPLHYQQAADTAAALVKQLLDQPFKTDVFSINIPNLPAEELLGVVMTRLGVRHYHQELVRKEKRDGRELIEVAGSPPDGESIPGTDYWALKQKLVSITPIGLDLTSHDDLSDHEALTFTLP